MTASSAKHVLAIIMLSVRPSVHLYPFITTRCWNKPS